MISDLPPTPEQVVYEEQQKQMKPVTFEDLKQVFEQALPSREAAPLDISDVRTRVQEANKKLEEEGFNTADLLHSAIIVFEQQRYYEISKLFFYTENVYDNLCKTIVESNAVSNAIKSALVPFNDVGFPKSVSVDLPVKSIKISLFDKQSFIKIAIEITYFSGKTLTFISHFEY